jgi:hypothetical protein
MSTPLSTGQFFDGAGARTPPALFIAPILLALLVLTMVDFIAGLGTLVRRA